VATNAELDPPKIAFVIGSLDRGGTERQIVEFIAAAHPHAARCLVVCLAAEGSLAGEARASGARVVSLGIGRMRWRPLRPVARLARLLHHERPDVVYGFLFHGSAVGFPAAALAAPRALRVLGCRCQPQFDGCPARLGVLRTAVTALAHGAIANSESVAAAWRRASPRLEQRIRTVPNGVRMGTPRSNGRTAHRPRVICVANLIPYKGHETLLEAARIVAETNRGWSLMLVGDGPMRGALEAQVEKAGLRDIVTMLGQRDDVLDLLDQADVAVLASYTEGMPNAVLEGMAHGLPVVATDVGGVPEILAEGGGIVVPPADAEALAGALRRLLEDEGLRQATGALGYEVARRSFGVPAMRDRTLAALESIRRRR